MPKACPDCGAPAPVTTAKVYACPGCGNPVLATERVEHAAAAAPVADAHAPVSHWKLVLVAVAVLGAAYVGVYALLTAEARRDRAHLLALHGEALRTAPEPGPPPAAAAEQQAWRIASERHGARLRYERHTRHVDLMFLGLIGAFAVNGAVVALLWFKSSRRSRGRPASRPASPSRGPGS